MEERINMSLTKWEIGRLLNVGLSKVLWAKAINMASYLINRSPRALLEWKFVDKV